MQSALIGLRFGYEVERLRFLSPLIASVMAPVVYFGSLHRAKPHPFANALAIAPHGIPLLLVTLSILEWPLALDAIIIGTFIVYAVLLLMLLRSGEDSLRLVTLEGVGTVHRALVFAALVLPFSAAVDTVITFDIAFMDARHVPQMVRLGMSQPSFSCP